MPSEPVFSVIMKDTGMVVNLPAKAFTEVLDIDGGIYREVQVCGIEAGLVIYSSRLESELRRCGIAIQSYDAINPS